MAALHRGGRAARFPRHAHPTRACINTTGIFAFLNRCCDPAVVISRRVLLERTNCIPAQLAGALISVTCRGARRREREAPGASMRPACHQPDAN